LYNKGKQVTIFSLKSKKFIMFLTPQRKKKYRESILKLLIKKVLNEFY